MMSEEVRAVNEEPERLLSDISIENLKMASDIDYKCDIIVRNLFGKEPAENEKERAIIGLKENEEAINQRLTTINNKLEYILSRL